MEDLRSITEQTRQAVTELTEAARLRAGDLLVVGCSTSEVAGRKIGSCSNMEIAAAIVEGIWPVMQEHGFYLAAQCCEHLNRALILERTAAERYGLDEVNVFPQPKAGGSFATAVYGRMADPIAVEFVRAKAGIDIGGTLIGMHLAPVAVPVRLSVTKIGEAPILCARTRPKFIGGSRADYVESLL